MPLLANGIRRCTEAWNNSYRSLVL